MTASYRVTKDGSEEDDADQHPTLPYPSLTHHPTSLTHAVYIYILFLFILLVVLQCTHVYNVA